MHLINTREKTIPVRGLPASFYRPYFGSNQN